MPTRRLPSIHAGGPGSTSGTGIYSSSASNFVFAIIGYSAIPATTFSLNLNLHSTTQPKSGFKAHPFRAALKDFRANIVQQLNLRVPHPSRRLRRVGSYDRSTRASTPPFLGALCAPCSETLLTPKLSPAAPSNSLSTPPPDAPPAPSEIRCDQIRSSSRLPIPLI